MTYLKIVRKKYRRECTFLFVFMTIRKNWRENMKKRQREIMNACQDMRRFNQKLCVRLLFFFVVAWIPTCKNYTRAAIQCFANTSFFHKKKTIHLLTVDSFNWFIYHFIHEKKIRQKSSTEAENTFVHLAINWLPI